MASRIVHLSDVHLGTSPTQARLFEALEDAVKRVARARRVDLVAITGDLFQSSTLDPGTALPAARELFKRLWDATDRAHLVVVPGNHDVRGLGVASPHRTELFDALVEFQSDGPLTVHGTRHARPMVLLPAKDHGLPVYVVLVDSSWLPGGYISAGGLLRQEDLLAVASKLSPDGRPVLLLMHHHLVPTPLTDLGRIQFPEGWGIFARIAQRGLGAVIAGGDREELTMTALGAGTALSTLHTLGRAVAVLHGHKHYPTVRLARGVFQGHGDVVLASAGSAGVFEAWSLGVHDDADVSDAPAREGDRAAPTPRLWPSFNVIDLDGDALHIDTVLYRDADGPPGTAKTTLRPMLRALRDGTRWTLTETVPDAAPDGGGERLAENRATFRFTHTLGPLWSADVTRVVRTVRSNPEGFCYRERVAGAPGSELRNVFDAHHLGDALPLGAELELKLQGESRYTLDRGFAADVAQAEQSYGSDTSPYEWAGLFNRYPCERAVLTVGPLAEDGCEPFASATDLGTGLERPLPITREGEMHTVVVEHCAPRTLLRVYWRLRG